MMNMRKNAITIKRALLIFALIISLISCLAGCGAVKEAVGIESNGEGSAESSFRKKMADASVTEIVVDKDLVLETPVEANGTKVIIGEGSITAVGDDWAGDTYMIVVPAGAQLTVKGSVTIDGSGIAGGIHAAKSAVWTLDETASVKNASAKAANTLVEGQFQMNGGTMTDAQGHNIYNKGNVTVSGGEIVGSGAQHAGIYGEGTLVQNGGTIRGAYNNVVVLSGGSFTFNGGNNQDSIRDGIYIAEGAKLSVTAKSATITGSGVRGIYLCGQANISGITLNNSGDTLLKISKTGTLNLSGGTITDAGYHGIDNAGKLVMTGGSIRNCFSCGIVNTGVLEVTGGTFMDNTSNKGILNKHNGQATISGETVMFSGNRFAIANEDNAYLDLSQVQMLLTTGTNVYAFDGTVNIHDIAIGASNSNNVRIYNADVTMTNVQVLGNSASGSATTHGILLEGGTLTATDLTIKNTTGYAIRNKGGNVTIDKLHIDGSSKAGGLSSMVQDHTGREGLMEIKNLTIENIRYNNVVVEGGVISITDGLLAASGTNNVKVSDGVLNLENVDVMGNQPDKDGTNHAVYVTGGTLVANDVNIQDAKVTALRVNGETAVINGKNVTIKNSGKYAIDQTIGEITIDSLTTENNPYNITTSGGTIKLSNSTLGATESNNVRIYGGLIDLQNVVVDGHIENHLDNVHALFVSGGEMTGKNVTVQNVGNVGLRIAAGSVNFDGLTVNDAGTDGVWISDGTATISNLVVKSAGAAGVSATGTANITINGGSVKNTVSHGAKSENDAILTLKNTAVAAATTDGRYAVLAQGGGIHLVNVNITGCKTNTSGAGIRINRDTSRVTGNGIVISDINTGISANAGSSSVYGVTTKNITGHSAISTGSAKLVISDSLFGISGTNNAKAENGGSLTLNNVIIDGTEKNNGIVVENDGNFYGYDITVRNTKSAAVRVVTSKKGSHITIDGLTTENIGTHNIWISQTEGKGSLGSITVKNADLCRTGVHNVLAEAGKLTLENSKIQGHLNTAADNIHAIYVAGSAEKVSLNGVTVLDAAGDALRVGTGTVVAKHFTSEKTGRHGVWVDGGELTLTDSFINNAVKYGIYTSRATTNLNNVTVGNTKSNILVRNEGTGKLTVNGLTALDPNSNAVAIHHVGEEATTDVTGKITLPITAIGVYVESGNVTIEDALISGGMYAVKNAGTVTVNGGEMFNNIWAVYNESTGTANLNGGYYYGNISGVTPSDLYNAGKLIIDDITVGYTPDGEGASGVLYQTKDAQPIVLKGNTVGLHTPSKPMTFVAENWNRKWGEKHTIIICDDADAARDVQGCFATGKNKPVLYISRRGNTLELTTQPGGNYIVSIGSEKFESFADAFAYMKDKNMTEATLQVLDSFETFEAVQIPAGYKITLTDDGTGNHVITHGNVEGHMFTVGKDAELILSSTNDSVSSLSLDGAKKADAAVVYVNGGKVTVNSAITISNSTYGIYMAGGVITADANAALTISGSTQHGIYVTGGSLTANNVTISGSKVAIHVTGGTAVLNGANISGSSSNNINVSGGELTINGYADSSKSQIGTATVDNIVATNGGIIRLNNVAVAASTKNNIVATGGKLYLTDSTVTGGNYSVLVQTAGYAELNNVTITDPANDAIRVNAADGKVVVSDVQIINPVRYGISADKGTVEVKGDLTISSDAQKSRAIYAYNGGKVLADDDTTVTVTGTEYGIYAESNSVVTLDAIVVDGCAKNGIHLAGAATVTVSDAKIINNHAGYGVYAAAGEVTIKGTVDENGNKSVIFSGNNKNIVIDAGAKVTIANAELGKTTSNNVQTSGELNLEGEVLIVGPSGTSSQHGLYISGGKATITGALTIIETSGDSMQVSGGAEATITATGSVSINGGGRTGVMLARGSKLVVNGKLDIANTTGVAMSIDHWNNDTVSSVATVTTGGEISIHDISNIGVLIQNIGVLDVQAGGKLTVSNTTSDGIKMTGGSLIGNEVTVNGSTVGINVSAGTADLTDVEVLNCTQTGIIVAKGANLTGSNVTVKNCRLGLVNYGVTEISGLNVQDTTGDHSIMNEGNDAVLTIDGATLGKSGGRNVALKGGTVTFKGEVVIDAKGGSNDAFCFYNTDNTSVLNIYGNLTVQNVKSDGIEIQNKETDAVINVYGNLTIQNVTESGIRMPVGTQNIHEGAKLSINNVDANGIEQSGGTVNVDGELSISNAQKGIYVSGGELKMNGELTISECTDRALESSKTGKVTLNGNVTVSSSNHKSWAIVATDGGTITAVDGTKVTITGIQYGIVSWHNSVITLDEVEINDVSADAIYADGKNATDAERTGVTINDLTVNVCGRGIYAFAKGIVTVRESATITDNTGIGIEVKAEVVVNNLTINTTKSDATHAHNIKVSEGCITLNGTTVLGQSNSQNLLVDGANAEAILNGTVTIGGTDSNNCLRVINGGNVTVNGALTLNDAKVSGINVESNGTVTFADTAVVTINNCTNGIYADGGSVIAADGTTVTINGGDYGIYSLSNSVVSLDKVAISGVKTNSIYVDGEDNTNAANTGVTIKGGSIGTTASAFNIYVFNGGKMSLSNVDVVSEYTETTTHTNEQVNATIHIYDSGAVTLDNVSITGGVYGLRVHTSKDVKLNNLTIRNVTKHGIYQQNNAVLTVTGKLNINAAGDRGIQINSGTFDASGATEVKIVDVGGIGLENRGAAILNNLSITTTKSDAVNAHNIKTSGKLTLNGTTVLGQSNSQNLLVDGANAEAILNGTVSIGGTDSNNGLRVINSGKATVSGTLNIHDIKLSGINVESSGTVTIADTAVVTIQNCANGIYTNKGTVNLNGSVEIDACQSYVSGETTNGGYGAHINGGEFNIGGTLTIKNTNFHGIFMQSTPAVTVTGTVTINTTGSNGIQVNSGTFDASAATKIEILNATKRGVECGGTFKVSNLIVTNAGTDAVYIVGTLNADEVTINTANNGVNAVNDGTVVIGKLTTSGVNTHGIWVQGTADVTVSGGSIGGTSTNNILVEGDGSTLTLTNVTVAGHKSTVNANNVHAIYVNNAGCTVTLTNITVNDTKGDGLRVGAGTVNVTNLTINSSGRNGIFVSGSSNVTIDGLKITDGTHTVNIKVSGGTVSIKNAELTYVPGDYHISNTATLTLENVVLSGDKKVYNTGTLNLKGKIVGSIYTDAAKSIHVTGALTTGSDITVDWAAGKVPTDDICIKFATGTMEASKQYIKLGAIQGADSLLYFTTEGEAEVGKVVSSLIYNETNLKDYLNAADANNMTHVTIQLGDSFTVASQVAIPAGIESLTINGQGKTITYGGTTQGGLFLLDAGKVLNLNNININGDGKANLYVPAGTVVNVENVTIEKAYNRGVQILGELNVTGNLTVESVTAGNKYAITVEGTGKLTGAEGSVITIDNAGYGLCVYQSGVVDIDKLQTGDGTIANAALYGDADTTVDSSITINAVKLTATTGIQVNGKTTVEIDSAEVTATTGLKAQGNTSVTIKAGTITGKTNSVCALGSATVSLDGVTLRNTSGNNLQVEGTANVTLKDVTIIGSGTATNQHGIYLPGGTVTVYGKLTIQDASGSSIRLAGGTMDATADGVEVILKNPGNRNINSTSGTLKLSNATLEQVGNMHNVYIEGGTIELTNCVIKGNNATATYHAIHMIHGTLTADGLTIQDSTYAGLRVAQATNAANVTLTNLTIKNCGTYAVHTSGANANVKIHGATLSNDGSDHVFYLNGGPIELHDVTINGDNLAAGQYELYSGAGWLTIGGAMDADIYIATNPGRVIKVNKELTGDKLTVDWAYAPTGNAFEFTNEDMMNASKDNIILGATQTAAENLLYFHMDGSKAVATLVGNLVHNEAELNAYLNAAAANNMTHVTIKLGDSFTVASQVAIPAGIESLTINGQGKTITYDGSAQQIFVWNDCQTLSLNNIAIDGNKKGNLEVAAGKNLNLTDVTILKPYSRGVQFNGAVHMSGTITVDNTDGNASVWGISGAAGGVLTADADTVLNITNVQYGFVANGGAKLTVPTLNVTNASNTAIYVDGSGSAITVSGTAKLVGTGNRGIYNRTGSLTVGTLYINDSSANGVYAAGVDQASGTVNVTNAIITGTTGKAIVSNAGELHIADLTVSNGSGNSIHVNGGTVTVDKAQIGDINKNVNNILVSKGTLTLKNATVGKVGQTNNICINGGTVNLHNVEVLGNDMAGGDGKHLLYANGSSVITATGYLKLSDGSASGIRLDGTVVMTAERVEIYGTKIYGIRNTGSSNFEAKIVIIGASATNAAPTTGIQSQTENTVIKITESATLSAQTYNVVGDNGTIEITGGTMNKTSSNNVATSAGIIKLTNCTVLGNSVTSGAIHAVLARGGDIELNNVTISGATVAGIRINNANSKVTATNVTITDCANGATMNNGELILNSVTISDTTENGIIVEGGTLSVSGKIVADIYFNAAKVLNVTGELTDGSDITVDWAAGKVPTDGIVVKFAADTMAASKQYIKLGAIQGAESLLYFISEGEAEVGKLVSSVVFNETDLTDYLNAAAANNMTHVTIKLGDSFTVASQVAIPAGIESLTINGQEKTITYDGSNSDIFGLTSGETLTLKDITIDGNGKGRLAIPAGATVTVSNVTVKNGLYEATSVNGKDSCGVSVRGTLLIDGNLTVDSAAGANKWAMEVQGSGIVRAAENAEAHLTITNTGIGLVAWGTADIDLTSYTSSGITSNSMYLDGDNTKRCNVNIGTVSITGGTNSVLVKNGTDLVIGGGTITGSTTAAISAETGTTVSVTNLTITNCTTGITSAGGVTGSGLIINGGKTGIQATGNATVELTDLTTSGISTNTIQVKGTADLTVTNGNIGGTTNNNILIDGDGSTLTLKDVTVAGHQSTVTANNIHAIYVNNAGCTATLTNVTVNDTKGDALRIGGGIVNVTNLTINSAGRYGIWASGTSNVTIDGLKILGGTQTQNIRVTGGTASVKNAELTYVPSEYHIYNTVAMTLENVVMSGDKKVYNTGTLNLKGKIVGSIYCDAAKAINVTGELTGNITVEWTTAPTGAAITFASEDVMNASKDNIALSAAQAATHLVKYEAAAMTLIPYTTVTSWADLSAQVSALTSGSNVIYKITGDASNWVASSGLVIPEGVEVTLFGDAASPAIVGESGVSLFVLANGCDLTLNDLTVGGASASAYAGHIIVTRGSVLNLNNTTVQYCKGSRGGAIHVEATAVLNAYESTFAYNNGTDYGGAIGIWGGTVNAENCDFIFNSASDSGGAIINYKDDGNNWDGLNDGTVGTLHLIGCTFDGNSSNKDGGAVDSRFTVATIKDCVFKNNSAVSGGAIMHRAQGTVEGCTFIGNTSTTRGGAIYSSAVLTVTDCLFEDNQNTGDHGGAIYSGNALTVTGSTFNENSTATNGGAIELNAGKVVTISGCTFYKNTATSGGAIMMQSSPSVTIYDCTFTENEAKDGGAIKNNSSTTPLRIEKSTFAGNKATTGNGGAIFGQASGNYYIIDSDFTDNTAATSGNAIYNVTGSAASHVLLSGGCTFNDAETPASGQISGGYTIE